MTFEEALRLRAGSLAIKASVAGGRRASAAQGAHGSIGNVVLWGHVRAQRDHLRIRGAPCWVLETNSDVVSCASAPTTVRKGAL
jgi:hypothetical protein